ncbi:MAG: hypothetical protein P4L71_01890 [Acetobacteraceae bacterium]|nr:hypothetical protein [Acetobacteraceae bacterium]
MRDDPFPTCTNDTTPDHQTLWCIHIPGPDDVIAQPDRETANRAAEAHNAAIERHWAQFPRTDDDPPKSALMAVVKPWPWSATAHAVSLQAQAEWERRARPFRPGSSRANNALTEPLRVSALRETILRADFVPKT